jgi:hypothetical protein
MTGYNFIMQFSYFTMHLTDPQNLEKISRRDFIQKIFTPVEKEDFEISEDTEYFNISSNEQFIVSKVRKKVIVKLDKGKREKELVNEDSFEKIFLIVDNRESTPNGGIHQTIALQTSKKIDAEKIRVSLIAFLNKRALELKSSYRFDLVTKHDSKSFWDAIKGKKITELKATYPVRNLFGTRCPVEEDQKEAETMNARKISHQVENLEEGLTLEDTNHNLQVMVQASSEGQSHISAKSGNSITYVSDKKPLKKNITVDENLLNNSPFKIISSLFEIFKL